MAPSLRHVAALTLALALAQPSCAEPEYFGEKPGDVELLSTKDFETKVLESSDLWLVEFYAPWCGHCQKLAPEWLDAAKRVKDTARLGAVDCTEGTLWPSPCDVCVVVPAQSVPSLTAQFAA
jgi:thioredoxin-like negative regulator of GroEL